LFKRLARLLGVSALSPPAVDLADEHPYFILLAGLTSVADWIGSSETFFPHANGVDPEEYVRWATERAEQAVCEMGWTGWRPSLTTKGFEDMFGFTPRPLQQRASEIVHQLDGPALAIVEAPMGEGKTEAAFYLSRCWNGRLGQKGCYVALPTQATSDQMFHRVRQFLATEYPSQKVNLQLLHGRAALSEEYRELRLNVTQDSEGVTGESGSVVAEEWFAPKKRGLLAPFAVGTVDQALLAVLQTRHSFVRLFGLAHKTVVIDEVHACDTYMSTLLERLLEWLHALGCTVVMLSATLPADRRQRLLAAFGPDGEPPPHVPYPRITYTSATRTDVIELEPEGRLARSVELRWVPGDEADLADTLSDALADGGCAVCICNTVRKAQKLYCALRRGFATEERILLHSRFPFQDRDTREKMVTGLFGKDNQQRPPRAVVVATQIVEQSLDVDFDLMVTDLAPADLVIQRAGRLHRHLANQDGTPRIRPVGLRTPQLWVMQPEACEDGVPDFGASEFVYARHTLLRSYLAFRERRTIDLPGNIEEIVEGVYGEVQDDNLAEPWQKALAKAKAKLEREVAEAVWTAKANLIKSPDDPDDILEDFCQQLREDDPSVHKALQALTRLTRPSVQVVCLEHTDDGLRLSADEDEPLDLRTRPALKEAQAILRRSMTISHGGLLRDLRDTEVPPGWRKNALLRHHRPLVFAGGEAVCGNYRVTLDPDQGLIVTRASEGQEGGTT
jgi:CRISPR-associated endonuclease/helicase Cas3